MEAKENGLTTVNTAAFEDAIGMIERARENAFRAVNRELISLYWEIGGFVSDKAASVGWGRSVVKEFSRFIQGRFVGIKGFSPQNVWRMKQFYETYSKSEKLSTLSREISWSNNVLILMAAKTDEKREFYLILAKDNSYSARELERQIDSALFERTMISNEKYQLLQDRSPVLASLRDSYVLEFLDIPERYKEKELRRAIIKSLRDFLLEFGRDFAFVGEEYRIQVGNTDFSIDLLLYNRGLSCLVAIELKIGGFRPEHLGQLEFYLEALDRDMKKSGENPSVGLILCSKKDDEVVEYALSRSMSPAMVAEYQTHLPDKALLAGKLRELRELAEAAGADEG